MRFSSIVSVFILSACKYVSSSLNDCLTCKEDICFGNKRISIWNEGVCIYDSTVAIKNVFYTGHVFSLGVCPAISYNVGKHCFDNIANSISEHLSAFNVTNTNYDKTADCKIIPVRSPCLYDASKLQIESYGYECSSIKILADNAVEECIRNDSDARFWATFFYWIGVLMIPTCFIAICFGCMGNM